MREQRKRLVGQVVSNKMDKTVVVKVERLKRHRLYHKVVKKSKKFKAHDAYNSCQVGDIVRIVESRPLSKEKRWIVEEIVGKANKSIGSPATSLFEGERGDDSAGISITNSG